MRSSANVKPTAQDAPFSRAPFLQLVNYLNFYRGKSRVGTNTRIDRSVPGVRVMSPFFSRLITIW